MLFLYQNVMFVCVSRLILEPSIKPRLSVHTQAALEGFFSLVDFLKVSFNFHTVKQNPVLIKN